MRTFVLRFSDAEFGNSELPNLEHGTIAAHREKLKSYGETWWGWWKKDREPFQIEWLDWLANYTAGGREATIGLVKRKGSETYYKADCIGCEYSEHNRILSPEPVKTPDYYASHLFPAWFKISSIMELDRDQFIETFGGVPELDVTIYETVALSGHRKLRPSKSENLSPIHAHGNTILHISDLHFGEGHGYNTEEDLEGRRVSNRPLWERLPDYIDKLIKAPIGALVVSGDLISKGNGDQYGLVDIFLRNLIKKLGITKDQCIIVPGNHDLWTLNVENPTRTYSHESNFRTFFRSFFGVESEDLEYMKRIRLANGTDCVFIALNSARIRSDSLKEYGYVAKHRYDPLIQHMTSALNADPTPTGKALIFGVMHHHVIPVNPVESPSDRRPVSLTLDA